MRNRKTCAEKNMYIKANESIAEKELRVMHAMVKPQFTIEDVIKWIFPEDTLQILKDTYPIVREHYNTKVDFNYIFEGIESECNFVLDIDGMEMAVPRDESVCWHQDGFEELGKYVKEVYAVHTQFNKVRDVIKWFGGHKVKPAAARYYWPAILSLLPETHDVHKGDGSRYRKVSDISEIIPLLRETSAIVTSAILCNKPETLSARPKFSVSFIGPYRRNFTVL